MCIRDSAALVLFRLVALLYRVFHLPLRQGSRGTDADTAYRAAGTGIKTTAGGRQCKTSKRFQL